MTDVCCSCDPIHAPHLVDSSEAVVQGEVESAGAVGGVAERGEGKAGGGKERTVRFIWCLAVVDDLWVREEGGREGVTY